MTTLENSSKTSQGQKPKITDFWRDAQDLKHISDDSAGDQVESFNEVHSPSPPSSVVGLCAFDLQLLHNTKVFRRSLGQTATDFRGPRGGPLL